MEQLQLFDIEPIPERPDNRKSFVVGKKRANRGYIRHSAPLLDELKPEVKKKSWKLSFSPKTTIRVPYDWTREQCLEYEKKFKGDDGKIKHDSVSEYSIFGGMATRT